MNIYYMVYIENYDIYFVTMYGHNKLKISNGADYVTIIKTNICNTCDIITEITKAFNLPYIRNLNKRVMIYQIKCERRQ